MTKKIFSLWGKHQPKDVWGDKYHEAEYFDALWQDRNEWFEIAMMLTNSDPISNAKAKEWIATKTAPDKWNNTSPRIPLTLSEWNTTQGLPVAHG